MGADCSFSFTTVADFSCTLQDYASVTAEVVVSTAVSRKLEYTVSFVFVQYGTGLVEVYQEHSESVRLCSSPLLPCIFLSLIRSLSAGIVAGDQPRHHCQCGLENILPLPFVLFFFFLWF